MQKQIELTTVIDQPVGVVWSVISDIDSFARAIGETFHQEHPGPTTVGSMAVEEARILGRFNVRAAARCTELDPGRVIGFTFVETGPFTIFKGATLRYVLEAIPEGSRITRTTGLSSGMVNRLLAPLMRRVMSRSGAHELSELKRSLEKARLMSSAAAGR